MKLPLGRAPPRMVKQNGWRARLWRPSISKVFPSCNHNARKQNGRRARLQITEIIVSRFKSVYLFKLAFRLQFSKGEGKKGVFAEQSFRYEPETMKAI